MNLGYASIYYTRSSEMDEIRKSKANYSYDTVVRNIPNTQAGSQCLFWT